MMDFSEVLIILAKTGDIKISFKNPQYLIEIMITVCGNILYSGNTDLGLISWKVYMTG